jgi:hypothetical protein
MGSSKAVPGEHMENEKQSDRAQNQEERDTDRQDNDTGLEYGPGQSTSTSNEPHHGGPNLEGTGQGSTTGAGPGGASPPFAAGVSNYEDPRDEQDRRERHAGTDRTDLEPPVKDEDETDFGDQGGAD